MVSFGCTGGCHRSVYAADALARHIRNKFNVKVELHHIEQNIKETKGFYRFQFYHKLRFRADESNDTGRRFRHKA